MSLEKTDKIRWHLNRSALPNPEGYRRYPSGFFFMLKLNQIFNLAKK